MGERLDLLGNLKHLIELDRAFGVEFMPRIAPGPAPQAAAPVPSAASQPGSRTQRAAPAPAPAPATSGTPAAPVTSSAPQVSLVPAAERRATETVPPTSGLPAVDLATIADEITVCMRCALSGCRKRTVPGEGNPGCELLFVGEGPGAEEDLQGRPFVGPAGELLTRMIIAMGLTRDEVFIANVVKCRPPGNRTPQPEEVAACMPFLRRQIAVLKPKLICTLGNTPLRALMGDDSLGITRMRGRQLDFEGIPVIPTFHPSYLLRNPDAKKPCWEDLQVVLKALGRPLPPRRSA
jgi:DNA polymerase